MRESPFCVALTGGVASGKSAVSERFAAHGIEVIDADLVARELVAPGMPALREIVALFGTGMLDDGGGLDRRAMRERVFADPDARRRLEGILHPRVRSTLHKRAGAALSAYVMLVIPLLAESGGAYAWVDRVLVVDVPREVQRARLMQRDGIGGSLADAMLDAQASREQRLAIADDIIANDGTLAQLDQRVAELHSRYLALAGSTGTPLQGQPPL
jgi:dephospho-CoA kinase